MTAVEVAVAFNRSECDQHAQQDHILRILKIGDEQTRWRQYREAVLTYYSIFEPGMYDRSIIGLRRVAPLDLYATAASKLRVVATRYAEKLMGCGCFLAGESHDGIIGVPRGALNLYLISNQYDAFTDRALDYAAKEWTNRSIKRFLMSSVRSRISHLRSVDACAPLLNEEKEAFEVLADFEVRLHRRLSPQGLAEESIPIAV